MADRYWRGGSGSWTAVNTANWSATSGGPGGASVPTQDDDVYFDANSDTGGIFTVTITAFTAVCRNLTVNTTDFTFTLSQSTGTLEVYGSLELPSTNFVLSSNVQITFRASTASNTILTRGVPLSTTIFNGTGQWFLTSSLTTSTGGLTLTQGSLNTSGFAVTTPFFNSNNSNVRTLTLNNSTFTINTNTGWNCSTSTNFTLSAGTSEIILSSTQPTFNGGGLTYRTVSYTDTTATSLIKAITGANTFFNLNFATPATSGCNNITFSADQIITGTLTATGSGGFQRLALLSNTIDTQRTLTCAAIAAISDVDFRDIRIAGAVGTLSGTRLGDCGGNGGITFAAPKTVWWSNSVGGNWGGDNFGASSGGAVSIANYPVAQDTVIINNSGAVAAGLTIVINGNYHMPSIDMTTRTTSLTLGTVSSFTVSFYGDLLYAGVVTTTGTSTYVFANRTIKTFSAPALSIFGGPLIIEAPGGGLAISATSGSIRTNSDIEIRRGTFTTNSINVSQFNRVLVTGTGAKTLNWGTSTLSNSSSLSYWQVTGTNITWNGAPNINDLTGGQSIFSGGGYTYGTLTMNPSGAAALNTARSITGTNTFSNIIWTVGSTLGWYGLSLSDNQTITGNFTITGTQAIYRAFIRSNTIGTARTLSVGSMTSTYIDFRDITLTGTAAPLSGTRLGDCGGNSGITFDAPSTKYWNAAAGGEWLSNSWANSEGGATSFENFPLAQDTVIVPNSGLNNGATITLLAPYNMPSLNLSTRTNSMTFAVTASGVATPYTIIFYGDLISSSSVTWTSPRADGVTESTFVFCNRSAKTLDTGGSTVPVTLEINCPGGGLNLTYVGITQFTRYFGLTTLARGTLNLSPFATLTTGYFSSSGTSTREIVFGTGSTIALVGSLVTSTSLFLSDPTNLTVTGDSDFSISGSGNRIINIGTMTESNSVNVSLNGAMTPTFSSSGTCTIKNLSMSGINAPTLATNMVLYGNLTMPANTFNTTTNTITFASSVTGNLISNASGVAIPVPIIFNGIGGQWSLQHNMGLITSIQLRNGTLNLNGKTLSATTFSTGEGTKNLIFNGATLTITGSGSTAFNNANPSGFTVTSGTGTGRLAFNSSSAKTFVGGGTTYNCTVRQAGSGTLTITGNNTFNAFENTVSPTSITFTANTTTTFNTWNVSGFLTNFITIRSSTPGVPYTLNKTSGTVSSSSLDLQDSIATGGATWLSYLINNNVNSGNNLGWQFYLNTLNRGYIIT